MKIFLSGISMLLLLSVLSLHSVVVQAVVISGLYEAEVIVPNQSTSNRKKNMAAVLRAVLIKLTGDRQVPSSSGVAEILLNADQYAEQFEYRITGEDGAAVSLWARFNTAALNKVLLNAAIPEWGRERPATLVWLGVADAHGRRLTGAGDVAAYVEKMDVQARNRGIALVHPLLDLEDTNQLKVSDIWDGLQEPVLTASIRYNADVILAGRLEAISSKMWKAHWTAYLDDQEISWVTQGKLSETVLAEGVDGLADRLARRYAQAGTYTQAEEVEILVNEIRDYHQYAKVLNYLESLNSVTKVEVKEADEDSVLYLLTTQADSSVISRAVGLGETLEQISISSYRLK